MYQSTIDQFAATAATKLRDISDNPFGFMIAAAMAGAYIGLAIILILSLGQLADPAARPLIMGVSFGLALLLVVYAGAELFTGHTMVMTLGVLAGAIPLSGLGRSWVMTWSGNLVGSVLIASLFILGGGGHILQDGADMVFTVAAGKMHAAPLELVARGILCNWLVCLALWGAARAKDDAGKAIMLFWCLFAFIASGYEHSVANMTIFALALLAPHPDTITLAGAAYNLAFVTLGNIIAGTVFMGGAYWLANGRRARTVAAPVATAAE